MDRLEELAKEREKIKERLSEIREEEKRLEFDNLGLPGKYLYGELLETYIHVDRAWISKSQKILMEGETLSFSADPQYFHWEKKDRVSSISKEKWKEISEQEWKEIKSKALEILTKNL